MDKKDRAGRDRPFSVTSIGTMVGERKGTTVEHGTEGAHYGMQLCSQARYMIILRGHGKATLWRGDRISPARDLV